MQLYPVMATAFVDLGELAEYEPVIPEDEVVLFPYDIDFDEDDDE
jgi:hypothetical protein